MEPKPLTLSQLNQKVSFLVAKEFASAVWFIAELSEFRVNSNGHAYAILVEKNEQGKIVAQSNAVFWRDKLAAMQFKFFEQTSENLHAGMKVLFFGLPSFHAQYGYQLAILDLDPSYTLGDMIRQRELVIAKLKADGIFDMNRNLQIPLLPQRLAVISSPSAAGYGDFIDQITKSGFAFYTKLFPTIMQGENASKSVVSSLELIFEEMDSFDAVVIVRGGGAVADLNCFDDYDLNFHLAQFPLPIISGIGHHRDQSITDMISCVACKTPTAVAEFLIKLFQIQLDELKQFSFSYSSMIQEKLNEQQLLLSQIKNSFAINVNLLLVRQQNMLNDYCEKLSFSVRQFLLKEKYDLQLLAKEAELNSPLMILSKGYAILSSEDGQRFFSTKDLSSNGEARLRMQDGEVRIKLI